MKKALKIGAKLLAVFLVALFVMQILPMTVMAQGYQKSVAERYASVENIVQDESPIAFELENQRDAYSKTFVREDGSYVKVISASPVHYKNGDDWNDIDNTLTKKDGAITNSGNYFSVDLPEQISPQEKVTITSGNNEISFSMDNITSSNAVVKNEKSEENSKEAKLLELKKKSSNVTYEDVQANTNLEYDVLPDSIKESIILTEKPKKAPAYSYTLDTKNAVAELNDDGRFP